MDVVQCLDLFTNPNALLPDTNFLKDTMDLNILDMLGYMSQTRTENKR